MRDRVLPPATNKQNKFALRKRDYIKAEIKRVGGGGSEPRVVSTWRTWEERMKLRQKTGRPVSCPPVRRSGALNLRQRKNAETSPDLVSVSLFPVWGGLPCVGGASEKKTARELLRHAGIPGREIAHSLREKQLNATAPNSREEKITPPAEPGGWTPYRQS